MESKPYNQTLNYIKDQFLPYDLALKLKDLGFDDLCLAGFLIADDGQFCLFGMDTSHPIIEFAVNDEDFLKTPLWQQAFSFMDKVLDLNYSVSEKGLWKVSDRYDRINISKKEIDINTARFKCLEQLLKIAETRKLNNT